MQDVTKNLLEGTNTTDATFRCASTNYYKIWSTKVILEQTNVERGLKYYRQFIAKHPHAHSLPSAK